MHEYKRDAVVVFPIWPKKKTILCTSYVFFWVEKRPYLIKYHSCVDVSVQLNMSLENRELNAECMRTVQSAVCTVHAKVTDPLQKKERKKNVNRIRMFYQYICEHRTFELYILSFKKEFHHFINDKLSNLLNLSNWWKFLFERLFDEKITFLIASAPASRSQ